MKLLLLLALLATSSSVSSSFVRPAVLLPGIAADPRQDNWWSHSVVYQVYPRSFQDSDGDGTGDLKGIESRLDYLADLGISAIWLSPVYKSPMIDFGYDISDFIDIDPIFGTMEDFQDLTAAAHERGINIIMDFVPNHSSDQHDWFIKSVQQEDPYTDYYVWEDKRGYDDQSHPIPPNNWVSRFSYSAWEYEPQRDQFYLHQFAVGQPDLNFRNPLVRQEMNDVLTFWLEQGVDGFRLDAVAHIMEDEELRDEPRSNNTVNFPDPDDYFHWEHIYTTNLPETRDVVLQEMFQTIKDFSAANGYDRVDMTEIYLPIEEAVKYYDCSDFPFNFGFVQTLTGEGPVVAGDVARVIQEWMDNLPEGRSANWVLGNHDKWRIGDRVGEELIDAMNMITMTLPGVVVTYNGEEIGMLNNMDISYEETVDPQGCGCGPVNYLIQDCSRDPERTPMQWSAEPNAGFSTPDAVPWLPINPNYVTLNVEEQQTDPASHLTVYKALVALRKEEPTFSLGQVLPYTSGEVLAVGRVQEEDPLNIFATVVNFGDAEASVDIFGQFDPTLTMGSVVINSSGGLNPAGTVLDLSNITLAPKEAIVIMLL